MLRERCKKTVGRGPTVNVSSGVEAVTVSKGTRSKDISIPGPTVGLLSKSPAVLYETNCFSLAVKEAVAREERGWRT